MVRLPRSALYGTLGASMISLRRLVPLLWFLVVARLAAQDVPAATPTASAASIFADERTARLAERYEAVLAANPSEGLALDRLWKFYEDAGNTGRLIDEYRHAADAPGSTAAASLIYGLLLKKAGRLDDAAAAYDRAAAMDPGSPSPALGRAEIALARSQPAEAASQFENALGRLPPGDHRRADLLLKTGNAWSAAGQPTKATESWEKMVALAPGDLNMHRKLAENYEKNGLPERAIGHYEFIEAHADPAGRAAALRELGRLHEARGEFDAARDSLERGLALTSRDNWLYSDLQTQLIRLYQRADRITELQVRWQQTVEQAPRDLGGYLRLELLAGAEGDTADERLWLEKIVSLSPRDRDSTLKLARLLADGGEREAAAVRYDSLLQTQPGNLDLILARADLDVQIGHQDAAVARVESRLAQNPGDDNVVTPALEFFLSRHLDAASEKILRAQIARQPAAPEPSVALAKFLFSVRRPDEARAVLDKLAAEPGESVARAARWMTIADAYREQNLGDDALRCWEQAASIQPRTTAPHLAASELLLARGDLRSAAAQLEGALDVTPPGSERLEVERKLFEVLQSAGSIFRVVDSAGASGEQDGLRWTRATPIASGASTPNPYVFGGPKVADAASPARLRANSPLGRYLTDLQKLATDQPTPDHSVRLAHWQWWSGNTDEASRAAERAIELDPDNLPARELLVTIASDTHRRDVAERRLREIITLDPSRRAACLRQIAALKADDNDPDAALEIYDELQKTSPGSVDALADLALAEQRADRWYDALATWERAYALPGLTQAQRSDVRHPLLIVYERLDQFQRAAEILQAAVDEPSDISSREEMFRELSDFCGKHGLGGWLEKEYQTRLTRQPSDYFTLTALAALTKDAGHERDAYALLKRAYFSSPDPASSLRTLADVAESIGENDEAVANQRRLTTLSGQATAENLGKLADLQAANLDDDAAAHTWDQIVAKFPRDPNTLERGAEFFESAEKTGRARELLKEVIALDAGQPRQMFHLARLDIDAGDPLEAQELLETLLARTNPEKLGDPLSPPPELDFAPGAVSSILAGIPGRRARTLGLSAPTPPTAESDEAHLRLDAIRELSRLLVKSGSDANRQTWLTRWGDAVTAGLRNEPLTAFFYSDQKALTMDLVTGWLKTEPADDRIRNTFLAAGLRLEDYRSLAKWVWHDADLTRKAERGQWLLGAIQQFLNSGGKPGPGMVGELFPEEVKLRDIMWEVAASAFAEHHWYAQAAELGSNVYALAPGNRSEYALKIAEWELYVGNGGRAGAVLRDAVDFDRGNTFEVSGGAVFAALRAYDLLLPESERAAFTDEYLQRVRNKGELTHAALAAVLLHGLAGDARASERDLDDLLAMRMLSTLTGGSTPDARRWNYILNNGAQLQAWGLDEPAAYYWRHALKETSAFERQDGDAVNFQAEIRGRLLGVDVAMSSDPQQAQERVTDYLRSGPVWDAVSTTAAQLLAAGQFPAAAQLYEALCHALPGEAENWRNLCVSYESAGDRVALERRLTFLLSDAIPLPAGMTNQELAIQLANVRLADGDGAGACRLLEHVQAQTPGVLALLIQLAQTEQRADRWEMAARVWTEVMPLDPTVGARISLAAVEQRLGRMDQAVTLLGEAVQLAHEPTRTAAAVQLAGLYVSLNRIDAARALGARLLQEDSTNTLPAVAAVFSQGGQKALARELLTAAVRRTHDPHLRYNAQQELVAQYATVGEDIKVFTREMRRLDIFARGEPGLRNAFAVARYKLARLRGADDWLEGELRREWDDSKGDTAAGEKLVALYLDTHRDDRLAAVVANIDHHPDLPEMMLHSLEEQLVQNGRGALALPMLERLRRRFPENELYAQDEARALWQAGHHDDADKVLEALDAISVFRDDLVGQAGAVYAEVGDRQRARQEFESAVRHDYPVVHHPQIDLRLARFNLEDHRYSEARRCLRLAYRNPTVIDLSPLVDYLAATEQLGGNAATQTTPGGNFPLTFPRRAQLLAAIYAHLTGAGRDEDARRWVKSHPELLAGAPGLIAEMRRNLPPSDLPSFAALLENAVAQTEPPAPGLERELAALYMQWAQQEAAEPARALEHLARAHELVPDDFDIARQMATACLAENQAERAVAALAGFLGPEALPTERAGAQQTLANPSPKPAIGE